MYIKIIKNFSFYLNKEKRKLLNLFPIFNVTPATSIPKISAYLSIYNDADILDEALNSIKPYVDELIVVDGAYEWMAPFLRSIGRNPEKSGEIVYEKIRTSGIPYKVINKIWKNEVEKRIAGFSEAKNQYVMRVDADEVIFFNNTFLKRFFNSNCAVAEMLMPTYVAPGHVIKGDTIIDKFRRFPRQCCLFDKGRISAEQHLRYLWLVLTVDSLPGLIQKKKIYPVFEKPIAFCAHLTNWRHVESSASRACFYTMNWMRKNGAPWVEGLSEHPISDFNEFFKKVPPSIFLEVMRNGAFVQGDILIGSDEKLAPSPLDLSSEKTFSELYKKYLGSLADRLATIKQNGSYNLFDYPFYFDISTENNLIKLTRNGEMTIEFSSKINDANVSILNLNDNAPFSSEQKIPFYISNNKIIIKMPIIDYKKINLRKVVKIIVSADSSEICFSSFKILS